jgi:ABC-type transport system involved in multi-copper enzyme maturation permease subunit
MSATIAAQMARADFLKLRKKRGTLIWALVLALAPVVIFYAVTAIQHASDPAKYGPAGGIASFHDGLRLLGGLFFGPLVAILIGVEAGTNDASAGVFRDLVVTGRSRLALFATRIPAALALCWTVIVSSYVLILLGTFAFASNLPTPDTTLILNGLGFLLLATGVLCAVAVGLASLTTSKPAAIIALIAWQVVASPLIVSIDSLGSGRNLVLSEALAHFSPLAVGGGGGGHRDILTMSAGAALLVIVLWLAVFVGLGAWRTRTMDA